MSARGGARGGGRGGRGGGGRGGRPGPPGSGWGDDLHKFVSDKPQEKYPPHKVTGPRPVSDAEKRALEYYYEIRRKIHEGPLYTRSSTVANSASNGEYKLKTKANKDPFTAVESYSDRFKPPKRALPELKKFPFFNKELFPPELRPYIETSGTATGENYVIGDKRSHDQISDPYGEDDGSSGDTEAIRRRLAQLMANDEGAEEAIQNDLELELRAGDGLGDLEDEEDDDFEEEEDDADNDYNAQGYWEDENNDDGDDGDDGGDGDDGYAY